MAFEQRFQRTQVNDRKVVNTLEDQNKYDISSSRRLRVQADPINMPMVANTKGASQLIEALSQVRPILLDAAGESLGKEWAGQIEQGKLDALKGLPQEEQVSKWREYGYNYQTSYLKGEDLGAKLEEAILAKNPEEDFGSWYKQWWETNSTDVPKDPETMGIFNKAFTGSLAKAQALDAKKKQALDTEKQYSVASESIYRSIKQVRDKGLPITLDDYSALKKETSTLYKFGNQIEDELFYNALERYSKENTDPDALNILYERRGDVPPLIDNPKYTDKITNLRLQLVSQRVTNTKAAEAETVKKTKQATEAYEQEVTFKMIELSNIEDPVQKSKAIEAIYNEVKDNKNKFNYSDGFIGKLESRINKTDKNEASSFQEQKYRELYTGDAPQGKIDEAVAQGDITQTQWDKLVAKKAADKQRAATLAAKGEKPIQSNADYKDAIRSIKTRAGYNPFNITNDGKEASLNASLATERYKEIVEDKVDSGVPPKQAIKETLAEVYTFMSDNNLISKDVNKAEKVIDSNDKVGQLKKDPMGFYRRNPEEFAKDIKSLPESITPENKAILQKNYLNYLAKKKQQTKPKQTQSEQEVK